MLEGGQIPHQTTHAAAFVAAMQLSVHVDSMTITDRGAERASQSNRTKRGYRYVGMVVTHTALWVQPCRKTATALVEDSF